MGFGVGNGSRIVFRRDDLILVRQSRTLVVGLWRVQDLFSHNTRSNLLLAPRHYHFANLELFLQFFVLFFFSPKMQTKMGMGGDVNGCGLCAKYSLFIANFIMFVSEIAHYSDVSMCNLMNDFLLVFQIGGAVLFGLGIWTLVDRSFMRELLGTNLFSGTVYVLIVTAAIVCLVSFFGCFGAAKEVKCLILFVSRRNSIQFEIPVEPKYQFLFSIFFSISAILIRSISSSCSWCLS